VRGPSIFITGVNMSQINRDALATMLRQFRKQGKPSVDGYGNCKYRGPDNAKCAAGCLISDKKYTPFLETTALQRIIIGDYFDEKFKQIDFTFLKHCQIVHDDLAHAHKYSGKSFAHTFLQNLKPLMYMYTTKEKQRNK
jgi:hypothetical protein